MKCIRCADTGWVCENHLCRPWEGLHGCDYGGAGMPCLVCNMADEESALGLPDGIKTKFDQKTGWRH
jgi:hypothetical protein